MAQSLRNYEYNGNWASIKWILPRNLSGWALIQPTGPKLRENTERNGTQAQRRSWSILPRRLT